MGKVSANTSVVLWVFSDLEPNEREKNKNKKTEKKKTTKKEKSKNEDIMLEMEGGDFFCRYV